MHSLETIRRLNARKPQNQRTPAHAAMSRIERDVVTRVAEKLDALTTTPAPSATDWWENPETYGPSA